MNDFAISSGVAAAAASLGPFSYLAWLAYPADAAGTPLAIAFTLGIMGCATCVGHITASIVSHYSRG